MMCKYAAPTLPSWLRDPCLPFRSEGESSLSVVSQGLTLPRSLLGCPGRRAVSTVWNDPSQEQRQIHRREVCGAGTRRGACGLWAKEHMQAAQV